MLKSGQLVVCVNTIPEKSSYPGFFLITSPLQEGKIYRLRWVGLYDNAPFDNLGTRLCVRVEGIVRPDGDTPYLACRFRPLVKKPEVNQTGFEILERARRNVSVEAFDSPRDKVRGEAIRRGILFGDWVRERLS